jgi:hypothetical protein
VTSTASSILRADQRSTNQANAIRWVGLRLASVLFALGAIARSAPLFDSGGRLLRQFPSEDGYLMLTLARNLALGHGMSSAEGTIPSNGTQPLATLLWALVFRGVNGDKTQGVFCVLLLQFIIAVAAAYAVYRLARQLLVRSEHGETAALLASALWFADSNVVRHTMNCLETGLYGLLLTVALALILRDQPRPGFAAAHWTRIGLMLGATFWARNDAILTCLVLAIVHLVWGLPGAPTSRAQRFAQLSLAGALVTGVAAPWLAFNQIYFGHVVPISGQSEAMDALFGENLSLTAPNLLEYLAMPLVVPHALETHPWVVAASAVVLVLSALLLLRSARNSASVLHKTSVRVGLLMALVFIAFYGLWFGAGHFMSRYMFALSPLCAVLLGSLLVSAVERVQHPIFARSMRVGVVASVSLVSAALLARDYRHGPEHMHFQVVDWVQQNLAPEAWIGAAQTGTIGYFHDRTINLDGKVNPYALAARKQNDIAGYVADSEIKHIVDWAGFASWVEPGGVLTANFELKLVDGQRNLAVLQRRAPPAPPRAPAVDSVASGEAARTSPSDPNGAATGERTPQ